MYFLSLHCNVGSHVKKLDVILRCRKVNNVKASSGNTYNKDMSLPKKYSTDFL